MSRKMGALYFVWVIITSLISILGNKTVIYCQERLDGDLYSVKTKINSQDQRHSQSSQCSDGLEVVVFPGDIVYPGFAITCDCEIKDYRVEFKIPTVGLTFISCNTFISPSENAKEGEPAGNWEILENGQLLRVSFSKIPRKQWGSVQATCKVSEMVEIGQVFQISGFGQVLRVMCPPVVAGPNYFDLSIGNPINQQIILSSGKTPKNVSLVSGNLPTGIKLSASGQLTGSPEIEQVSTVFLKVTDAVGCSDRQFSTLVVKETSGTGDYSILFNPSQLSLSECQRGVFLLNIVRKNGFTGKIIIKAPNRKSLRGITLDTRKRSSTGNHTFFHFNVERGISPGLRQLVFTAHDEQGQHIRLASLDITVPKQ